MDDVPRVEVTSLAELEAWLAANHATAGTIWLVTHKKSEGARHVPYADVVDAALAHGWIDSLPRKLDERRSMLRLSPRKPGSAWSAVNKAKVERLAAAGRLHPAGLAAIERAKADGSWSALDGVETLAPPDDLVAAFALHAGSAAAFEAFPKSVKRGILEWIAQAKTAATRGRRVEETARLAAEGRRANQWKDGRKA